MAEENFVIDLDSIQNNYLTLVGSKAENLFKLRRIGFNVPEGFCVTGIAYTEHLNTNKITDKLSVDLIKLKDAASEEKNQILSNIRLAIIQSQIPDTITEQIRIYYQKLKANYAAVRSSSAAEDLPGHSFAGLYDTFLNIDNFEKCLDATKRCWASLWTLRAYEYRQQYNFDHHQIKMSVIIQRQIEPESAGVAFSLDPVTGSSSRIVIESCRGLGEALVSGKVQPDRILLRKKNLKLIRQHLVSDEPSLNLKAARKLARYVRKIEKEFGCPQDIEWAFSHGRIWFLQTRPVTAIGKPKSWEDRQVWTNVNLGEVVPDVMTPVTYSTIMSSFYSLFGNISHLFGADAFRAPLVGLVAGRLYFNINYGLAALQPFLSQIKIDYMQNVFGGEQHQRFELGEYDICDEDVPDLGFSWPKYILSWPGIICSFLRYTPAKGDLARARMRTGINELRRLDFENMSTAELAHTICTSQAKMVSELDLMYLFTSAPRIMIFERACRKWLRDKDFYMGYRLMAAQGGMADTEAGLDMWRLAGLAHTDVQTESILMSGDSWSELQDQLKQAEHGRIFLEAWDKFMDEHGHHCRGEIEFFNARWSERPDYVLDLVRNYLRSIEDINPVENHQRLALEREELVRQCRMRLKNPLKRALFNWSLKGAAKVAVDRENWKNEFIRLLAVIRRMLLIIGKRFEQAGILNRADDVFFLELSEIEPLANGQPDSNINACVAERLSQYEKNKAVTPPPVVVGRFDPQKYVQPRIDETVTEFKGIAVSPGIVTGKARVILRTEDNSHVEPGEILVAPTTDPAWTPYFLTAAGVVMDMGGVLSHGAIVAREYGIPAVVNVGSASRIIKTGQTVQVDAINGIVTIID